VTHPNARLEALSDGVFAIAMTLLVLDLRLPSPETLTSSMALWAALRHLAPEAFAFILSFAVILITWVSHHGILKLVQDTSARFIYANGVLRLPSSSCHFPPVSWVPFLPRITAVQLLFSTMASWQGRP
jgi:uncharacterized membrane protein